MNIKYIKPLLGCVMSGFSMKNVKTQYMIVFNDGSELDLVIYPQLYFSITDMMKGKERNNFKKMYTAIQALTIIETLEKTLGYTDSNVGDIILVDKTNIITKVQI